MNNVISISCASDEAYYCGLLVTLHSIVSNAAEGSHIRCHVLDTGLSDSNRHDLEMHLSAIEGREVEVVFHNTELLRFSDMPKWRGSHAAYARIVLQDILKDEDFTIYTDIDTLWMRDVSTLWNMREKTPVLAAVPDGSGHPELSSGGGVSKLFEAKGLHIKPEEYYCTGLLLLNLKELRSRNFTERCIEVMKNNEDLLGFADQNLYNWFFQPPEVLLLDHEWGIFSTLYGKNGDSHSPCVIHYARQAPWKKKITAAGMLWWDYVKQNLKKSPFCSAATSRSFRYRLLKNRFVFNCLFGFAFIFNRKAYRKRYRELNPFGQTTIQP